MTATVKNRSILAQCDKCSTASPIFRRLLFAINFFSVSKTFPGQCLNNLHFAFPLQVTGLEPLTVSGEDQPLGGLLSPDVRVFLSPVPTQFSSSSRHRQKQRGIRACLVAAFWGTGLVCGAGGDHSCVFSDGHCSLDRGFDTTSVALKKGGKLALL